MNSITRDQLSALITDRTVTRTIHDRQSQLEEVIEGDWIVVLLDISTDGVLNLYCEKP